MKNRLVAPALVLAGLLAAANPASTADPGSGGCGQSQTAAAKASVDSGDRAFQRKDYSEAVLYYSQAIGTDPTFVNAWVQRAWAYLRLGATYPENKADLDKALADVAKAMGLDPANKALCHLRGKILMSKAYYALLAGDRAGGAALQDEAMADYRTALGADPGSNAVLVDIGHAYSAKGDLDRAMQAYSSVYEKKPDEPGLKASLEALFGEYERQRRDLNFGGVPRTWVAAGVYFAGKRQYDVAVACYSRALALGWTGDSVYMRRSTAYAGLGDLDRAMADAKEDVKLNPDGYAYAYRGQLYEKKGDLIDALADLGMAVTLAEKDPVRPAADYRDVALLDFRRTRALMLEKLNSWDKAIEDLAFVDRYLLPGGPKAEINYELAKAYQGKGDARNAKKYDRIARKMDPALKK